MDPITLVTKEDLEAAWRWLHSSLSPRPATPGADFIFDRKSWNGEGCCGPLTHHESVTCCLGNLYLASQLADLDDIFALVSWGVGEPVKYYGLTLDEDVAAVAWDEQRFRNHLSEHVSFWVRLASEPNNERGDTQADTHPFGHTRPNIQPEDKGPDGLFLSLLGRCPSVEVLSVKNSINDPQPLISYAAFRTSGEIDESRRSQPLLEGFCLVAKGKGFVRLDEKLSSLCKQLGLRADQERRAALLTETRYNGVVVADEQYADETLFLGFGHVVRDPTRCIATYVGSERWEALAEQVRMYVVRVLLSKGLL